MRSSSRKPVAIIGSGPAGLMTAFVVASAGHPVKLFEKKKGPGRKLLIAGSSGLNVTYDHPQETFFEFYRGPSEHFRNIFSAFSPQDWLSFIQQLGIPTFKGTSRRFFVEGLKASNLLRAWLKDLADKGATISNERECVGFEARNNEILLRFDDDSHEEFSSVCFCLGGASWEPQETPLRWPKIFLDKNLNFASFAASNVGYQVDWPKEFLDEADGQPLKNIVLTTSRGSKHGDLMITRYGIEGTPVYFHGATGTAHLDLKPDLTYDQILIKLRASKENLSPIRRMKKLLQLSPASLALLFHCTPKDVRANLEKLTLRLKSFPLELKEPQPIQEAISSSGGLDWSELDDRLMLKRFPGVFAAGEMLNWDAPTGGFLIQACVSQGHFAGQSIVKYLASLSS